MRPLLKAAGVFGALVVCLFALSVIGGAGPFGLPTGLGNAVPILWGVPSDAGTFALLDGGTQQSMCTQNLAGMDAITCTAFDAGTTVGLGGFSVLASNDCVRFYPITTGAAGAATAQTTGLIGGPGVAAIDPITSGAAYYALVVDAGGATAGFVTCSINNKGGQP